MKAMRRHIGKRRLGKGFTLLEMCAASAVSILLIVCLLAILNHVSSTWVRNRGDAEAFASAANAFDVLTRTLSQAVLNTYWSYDDNDRPTQYVRASELHFLLGKTASTFGINAADYPGSAVFFQAPLGKTQNGHTVHLPARLNGAGFFTAWGENPNFPSILDGILPNPRRFRLFEWVEPTGNLEVYRKTDNAWIPANLFSAAGNPDLAPLGENILALFVIAEYPLPGGSWMQSYSYDSRSANPDTLNQLPPQLRVALVAMDEASARRLEQKYGGAAPPIGPKAHAFESPDRLAEDLADWQSDLLNHDPPVQSRIFSTTIVIPNSRWSLQ